MKRTRCGICLDQTSASILENNDAYWNTLANSRILITRLFLSSSKSIGNASAIFFAYTLFLSTYLLINSMEFGISNQYKFKYLEALKRLKLYKSLYNTFCFFNIFIFEHCYYLQSPDWLIQNWSEKRGNSSDYWNTLADSQEYW